MTKNRNIYRGRMLKKPILLGYGKKRKYHWVIITMGSHPCAYIGIKKGHPLYEKDCEDIFEPHGGITYSSSNLSINPFKNKDIYWLGWDYGHSEDYHDFRLLLRPFLADGTKWTYKEIKTEVMIYIKRLRRYLNE